MHDQAAAPDGASTSDWRAPMRGDFMRLPAMRRAIHADATQDLSPAPYVVTRRPVALTTVELAHSVMPMLAGRVRMSRSAHPIAAVDQPELVPLTEPQALQQDPPAPSAASGPRFGSSTPPPVRARRAATAVAPGIRSTPSARRVRPPQPAAVRQAPPRDSAPTEFADVADVLPETPEGQPLHWRTRRGAGASAPALNTIPSTREQTAPEPTSRKPTASESAKSSDGPNARPRSAPQAVEASPVADAAQQTDTVGVQRRPGATSPSPAPPLVHQAATPASTDTVELVARTDASGTMTRPDGTPLVTRTRGGGSTPTAPTSSAPARSTAPAQASPESASASESESASASPESAPATPPSPAHSPKPAQANARPANALPANALPPAPDVPVAPLPVVAARPTMPAPARGDAAAPKGATASQGSGTVATASASTVPAGPGSPAPADGVQRRPGVTASVAPIDSPAPDLDVRSAPVTETMEAQHAPAPSPSSTSSSPRSDGDRPTVDAPTTGVPHSQAEITTDERPASPSVPGAVISPKDADAAVDDVALDPRRTPATSEAPDATLRHTAAATDAPQAPAAAAMPMTAPRGDGRSTVQAVVTPGSVRTSASPVDAPLQARAPSPIDASRSTASASRASAASAVPAGIQRRASSSTSASAVPTSRRAPSPSADDDAPAQGARPLLPAQAPTTMQVPADVRAAVEQVTGSTMSTVAARTGGAVQEAASGMRADAFTVDGIVHLPTLSSRGSEQERAVLAHELTHVVQQRRLGSSLPHESSAHGQVLEAEARQAEEVLTSRMSALTAPRTPGSLPGASPLAPANAAVPAAPVGAAAARARATTGSTPTSTPTPGASPSPAKPVDLVPRTTPSPAAPSWPGRADGGSGSRSAGLTFGGGSPGATDAGTAEGGSVQRRASAPSRPDAAKAERAGASAPTPAPASPGPDTARDQKWLERHAEALYPLIRAQLRAELFRDRERRGRLMREP